MVEKSFLNRQEDESPEYKPLTAIKLNAFKTSMRTWQQINIFKGGRAFEVFWRTKDITQEPDVL